MQQGILFALTAAALFGASTPLAKLLLGQVDPVMLAGLLYLGSGVGLYAWRFATQDRDERRAAALNADQWPRMIGVILSGGIAGPVLLMIGLNTTPAATASLLLNLEGVLTALLAWAAFREHIDRRVALGMLCIVAGGVLLSWQGGPTGVSMGVLAIVAACLCWAIDNNLTRTISAADAVQIAAIKGISAGSVNLVLSIVAGASLPSAMVVAGAGAVGLAGYGISLALSVLAMRHLGAARTGGYFSIAPFVGAALSLLLFGGSPGLAFWSAGGLMAIGLWLHLSERHAHWHEHEAMTHAHRHVHDAHHQHEHDADWDGTEPHTHVHDHEPMAHRHPHFPDIHHRHRH